MRIRLLALLGPWSVALALGAAGAEGATVAKYCVEDMGCQPSFVAGPGEANRVTVTGEEAPVDMSVRFEDSGALLIHPVTGDYLATETGASLPESLEGCTYDLLSATCSYWFSSRVLLGDKDDSVTVKDAPLFHVDCGAGMDTAYVDPTVVSLANCEIVVPR